MKKIELFKKLNLSAAEGKIYMALIDKSPLTIAEIAKTTGLYRPTIYRILPALAAKQLISQTRIGKRIKYVAESPDRLKAQIEKIDKHLDKHLPELLERFKNNQEKPVIRFFEGKRSIKRIYEDMVREYKKGDIVYRYESPKNYRRNKKYYPKLYMERAGQKKHSDIEKFVITNEKTHNERSPQLERYSKFVPSKCDGFNYDITQIIFKNRVIFIDYSTKTASIIESRSFAKFQKKIYRLLFKQL